MVPPDRMFLTSAWLESIIYGINCALFGACIYILVNRDKKSHKILYASCILHISISTTHNIITLLQSLQGFTTSNITSVTDGSSMYFITPTPLMVTNSMLYVVNVFAQDLLLIWRLYVVWNHNWALAIASLIVEAAHIACSTTAVIMISQPGNHLFSHNVQAFGQAGWSLDLFLNTAVTSGIAYRLWRAGRDVSDFTGRHVYKSAMITIVESGALIASCTIVMFALDIAGSPAGLIAINVAVQIATTTPLLIIARLGRNTPSDNLPSPAVTFAPPVRIDIAGDICTYQMDSMTRFPQKTESTHSSCDV